MRFVFYGVQLYRLFLSNRKKFLYIPLASYWLFIFILTSIPGNAIPKFLGFSDKLKHFGAYSVLSFLLYFAFYTQNKYPVFRKYSFISTFVVTVIYGLFDEVHQLFIPGRFFDWYDLLADAVGGLIGILLAFYIISMNEKENLKI